MPPRRRLKGNAPVLQNRLALHRFVCREFGYEDMDAMLGRLRDLPAEYGAGGESSYAQALSLYAVPALRQVTPERLGEYDANIAGHSHRLGMTAEHGRTWKPHQYLALLFTEHYLRRYFDDPEALRADLNRAKRTHRPTWELSDYEPDELRTLAFQSATGSGKTLIMHAHILQYRHYLDRAGGTLNNVVLVTPNEQMSAQHERELRESGLHARLFSSEAGSDLFAPVEIIDLNKLAERKGVKRVAVKDFGDDNLVLVDEGHLGASGNVWRQRRKELSRGGFTFEYSATFNQVVGRKDATDLLHAYGKCLLFDYAYRRFHEDGYGKDYAILNLPGGVQDENSDMYLLGCLLTFYQQCRIWREEGALWRAFNPAKPLWVFLGKTVTGSSKAASATRSDVARILNFLGWVLARGDSVRPMIERLLSGQSGLLDDSGRDYFAGRYSRLPETADETYADLCKTLFRGPGRLHVVYLTAGEGELHLRTADRDPFGVVNVGDAAALYKLLIANPNPHFEVHREMGFAARLFDAVDRPDSTVNIVIGARRFIAGWNSWRVSTMGLMHVGVGEGPEIIQMFGRGVRLKGWNMSLKRHRESGGELPAESAGLEELETLYIFGLRANYMQTFRDLLHKEGMRAEEETFTLPVTWNFARNIDLKLIRLKTDSKYGYSEERLVLPDPADAGLPLVTVDLYSRLQSVASDRPGVREGEGTGSHTLKHHAAFFDTTRIFKRLRRRRRQRGWHNLIIRRSTVERLLRNDDWYELNLPPERLNTPALQQVWGLENIALELVTEYAARYWRRQRRRWEHGRIEVVTLGEDDPNNFRAYQLSVNAAEARLVKDARELAATVRDERFDDLQDWYERLKVGVVRVTHPIHAYQPLLHVGQDRVVTVQPLPLDENEKRVVEGLASLAAINDACLQGQELYLIRNLTRGRGVSFFDDFGYYPDFIAWLKDGVRQHVLFLDPKGLGRFGGRERRKVRLHREIASIEHRVRMEAPNLRLRAYVLSVTPVAQIDNGARSASDWNQDGVYFLNEPDCLRQVIEDALAPASAV